MNQPQLGNLESIALDAIRPSTTNPRKHFDDTELNGLRDSIKAMGVTQPILVRPQNDAGTIPIGVFEIVSGERRHRAAGYAGRTEIPAFVRELTDAEALDIQMIENLQRADLHPIEEAEGYRHLLSADSSTTAEDIAKKTGKTLAYVQQRIKLLSLEVDAKKLFADGHLTLGHALDLAKLTPRDQERALMFLVGLREWELKKDKSISWNIFDHIKPRSFTWMLGAERAKAEAEEKGKRVVKPTEAELKTWIQTNVLLVLKGVPWDLGDAELLPIAGPCTTCPKRTGAMPALFQDLTTVADTCTDPACFAEKQKAFTARELATAQASGAPRLKLSEKRSVDKLAAPVIEFKPGPLATKPGKAGATVPTVKAVVTTKKAIKQGQWVEAKKGSCPAVVEGLFTDGPNQGKTKYVCADQSCKVHKHHVDTPRSTAPANKLSPEVQDQIVAAEARTRRREAAVRVAVFRKVIEGGKLDRLELLREVAKNDLDNMYGDGALTMAEALGISVDGPSKGDRETDAYRAIEKYIKVVAGEQQLLLVILAIRNSDVFDLTSHRAAGLRKDLEELGKKNGVANPGAVMSRAEEAFDQANPLPVKEVAKPATKKTTVKKLAKSKSPAIDGKSAAAGEAVEARA